MRLVTDPKCQLFIYVPLEILEMKLFYGYWWTLGRQAIFTQLMLHKITLLPSQLKSHINFMQMELKTENCFSIAQSNVLFIEYIHSVLHNWGIHGEVSFFTTPHNSCFLPLTYLLPTSASLTRFLTNYRKLLEPVALLAGNNFIPMHPSNAWLWWHDNFLIASFRHFTFHRTGINYYRFLL